MSTKSKPTTNTKPVTPLKRPTLEEYKGSENDEEESQEEQENEQQIGNGKGGEGTVVYDSEEEVVEELDPLEEVKKREFKKRVAESWKKDYSKLVHCMCPREVDEIRCKKGDNAGRKCLVCPAKQCNFFAFADTIKDVQKADENLVQRTIDRKFSAYLKSEDWTQLQERMMKQITKLITHPKIDTTSTATKKKSSSSSKPATAPDTATPAKVTRKRKAPPPPASESSSTTHPLSEAEALDKVKNVAKKQKKASSSSSSATPVTTPTTDEKIPSSKSSDSGVEPVYA